MSDDDGELRGRLSRWLSRSALPPEPPYPEEQRRASVPRDASWTERYEAAVEAENRFLAADPDRHWHILRALVPLAVVGVVIVAFLFSVLLG